MVRPLAAGQLPPDWYDVYNSNIYGSGKIDINCIANIVRNDLRLKSVLQGMNLFWTSPPHGWWLSLIDSYSHSISSKALVVSINQGSSLTPPNPSFFPLMHQTNTLQYLALKLVCLLGWLLRLMLFGQLEAPGGVFSSYSQSWLLRPISSILLLLSEAHRLQWSACPHYCVYTPFISPPEFRQPPRFDNFEGWNFSKDWHYMFRRLQVDYFGI